MTYIYSWLRHTSTSQTKKHQIFPKFFIFIVFFVFFCATSQAKQSKELSPKEILDQARIAIKNQQMEKAANKYEHFLSLAPFHKENKKARVEMLFAQWMDHDSDEALQTANHFLSLYPNDAKYTPYVLFMKGSIHHADPRSWLQKHFNISRALFDVSSEKEAFHDFKKITSFFPKSPYANIATSRQREIHNILGKHEFIIGKQAFEHHLYLAAANRFLTVLKQYPQANIGPENLEYLKKSYASLNLLKQNQDITTLHVVSPCKTQTSLIIDPSHTKS
jgi:outer membrane protein assembly factor BamD